MPISIKFQEIFSINIVIKLVLITSVFEENIIIDGFLPLLKKYEFHIYEIKKSITERIFYNFFSETFCTTMLEDRCDEAN